MRLAALFPGGPQVAQLGFGGGAISGEGGGYGFGLVSEAQASSLLLEAFDGGVNFFDTAPIYGFGESERRMGKALKGKRDKILLATKGGITWDSNQRVNLDNNPKVIEAMLHQSLKDLQTDYVDVYFIHWPDDKVDIRKPMEVLQKAQAAGKIKYIGLCNTFEEDLVKASEIAKIQVVQSEFSLLKRDALKLFPYFKEHQIGFMSWGTLDKGIITQTVTKQRLQNHDFDEADARSRAPWWKKSEVEKKIESLKPIFDYLKDVNVTPLQLAVWHNLLFQEVSMILCGPKNSQQLQSLLQGIGQPLSSTLVETAVSLLKNN